MKGTFATSLSGKKPQRAKYDFEKMKAAATSEDAQMRKRAFVDYFERFEEFPSYLFDNESGIDGRLQQTINDLLHDPETSDAMRKGIESLVVRLNA